MPRDGQIRDVSERKDYTGTTGPQYNGYQIALFDGLRVTTPDGAVVTRFRTRKTALLLAYMSLFPRRHAREALIELFWPDLPLDAGRDNLSGCLSSLRRHFAPQGTACGGTSAEIMLADRAGVWLNTDATSVDVAAFERLLDAPDARSPMPTARRAALEAAIALYPAPLLPDIYEEWVLGEQARLGERCHTALAALAEAQRLAGDDAAALATIGRARQADPYNEASYQTEMRLRAADGQVTAAVAVFDKFSVLLTRELGCGPSRALVALRERLPEMARQSGDEPIAVPDPAAPPTEASAETVITMTPTRFPPVPPALNRLWGRDAELDRIAALCDPEDDAPARPRLITITGVGGVGKTRFVLALAERLATSKPRRELFYIPLADVSDGRFFLPLLQQALGIGAEDDPFAMSTPTSGAERLRTDGVLILDNLEHLLVGGAPEGGRIPALLRLLLERLPRLMVVATSRRVCGIGGEQEFPLAPLAVPPATLPAHPSSLAIGTLEEVSSVALFLDRARSVRPDFVLTVGNATAVCAICRSLEGLPLALEMAGAWVRTLAPAQIVERLEGRSHDLHSRRRDLPARHRSLRAALEWGWELLEPELRPFLARLSVFRGGWTLAAAEAVTGEEDSADALARLQEHSLVQQVPSADERAARFRLLEPVREWGLEKLAEDARARRETADRHAAFFVAATREARGKATDAAAQAHFRADEENCVAAFTHLIGDAGGDALANATAALTILICLEGYWSWRGLHIPINQLLAAGIVRYHDTAGGVPGDDAAVLVLAEALYLSGFTAYRLGRLAEADEALAGAGALFETLGERVKALRCAGTRGTVALERGDLAAASARFLRALTLAREWHRDEFVGTALLNLGAVAHEQGDFDRARDHYEEALPWLLTGKDCYGAVCILLNQATLALQQNAPDQALVRIREGLDIAVPMENPRLVANLLATAAAVAARKGQATQAVRLFAAADRIVAESGAPLLPTEVRDRALTAGGNGWRQVLSPSEIAHAEAEGRAMTFDEAVGAARGDK